MAKWLLLFLLFLPATVGAQVSSGDAHWNRLRGIPPGFADGIDNVNPFAQDFYAQTAATVDADIFMPLNGAGFHLEESMVQNLVARAGTFTQFACRIHAPSGEGSQWDITVHINTLPTDILCSINHPTTTCRDTENSLEVKVGDLLNYAIMETGDALPTHFTCTARFTE